MKLIKIGKITSSHGLKGNVFIFPYSEHIESYDRFYLGKDKIEVSIDFKSRKKKLILSHISNISSKEEADELKNQLIYIKEDALEEIAEDDDFYTYQLTNLSVINQKNEEIGKVVDVVNHGAGDNIIIKFSDGNSEEYPFLDFIFPEIDLEKGTILFQEPETI